MKNIWSKVINYTINNIDSMIISKHPFSGMLNAMLMNAKEMAASELVSTKLAYRSIRNIKEIQLCKLEE